ncbi:curlin [Rhizobium helianthi]|uniref:Curlin n=1 Tax=Rhizobium helianthi TaxID=1132695 RepID=A0ABW4M075_9HYPH
MICAALAGTTLPAMTTPAMAGGSVSFNLAPPAEGADLLSTGMRIYSMYRGLKNGEIRQNGEGNAAGLYQGGRGNIGFIRQRGQDHRATLRQTGEDNAYGIFQYGRGTQTDVEQRGYGQSGLTFSYGW